MWQSSDEEFTSAKLSIDGVSYVNLWDGDTYPDPLAMAWMLFSIPWERVQEYAFPPFALIGKCLQKL